MHRRLNYLALGKNLIMTNMTSYDWWGSHLQLLFPFSWFIVVYKFVIYVFNDKGILYGDLGHGILTKVWGAARGLLIEDPGEREREAKHIVTGSINSILVWSCMYAWDGCQGLWDSVGLFQDKVVTMYHSILFASIVNVVLFFCLD